MNLSNLTNNAQILSIIANQTGFNKNIPHITPDSETNFKQLISELLNKNLSDEKINIIKEITSNEKIYTALYQSIAILNITGELNNIPAKMDDELAANNIIKEIIISNNLNQNEANLLLKSIKLAAIEIVSGADTKIIENGTQTKIVASNLMGNNSNSNSYTDIQKINNQSVINTHQRLTSIPQNTDYNLMKKPNTPEPLITNVIENNSSIPVSKISFIKVDNILTVNNSQKIIPGQEIIPEQKNDSQHINMLNTVNMTNATDSKNTLNMINGVIAGKTENLDLKLTTDILYNNIENIVKDLKISLDRFLSENNQRFLKADLNVSENIKSINFQINEIINNLNQLKDIAVNNNLNLQQDAVKADISSIVDKLINIIIVIHRVLAQQQYGTVYENFNNSNLIANNNANTKNLNNEIINIVDLSSNHKPGDGLISKQSNGESELFNEIKNSVMKIFNMLKELNGEMQVYKKIEYVYQPNTTKTSTVTKEGVLLINLSPIEKASFDLQQTNLQIKNIENLKIKNNLNSNYVMTENINKDEQTTKPQIISNLNSDKVKNIYSEPDIDTQQLKLDIPTKENKNEIVWLINKINNYYMKDNEFAKIDKNNLFINIDRNAQKIKQDIIVKQIVENLENAFIQKRKV